MAVAEAPSLTIDLQAIPGIAPSGRSRRLEGSCGSARITRSGSQTGSDGLWGPSFPGRPGASRIGVQHPRVRGREGPLRGGSSRSPRSRRRPLKQLDLPSARPFAPARWQEVGARSAPLPPRSRARALLSSSRSGRRPGGVAAAPDRLRRGALASGRALLYAKVCDARRSPLRAAGGALING